MARALILLGPFDGSFPILHVPRKNLDRGLGDLAENVCLDDCFVFGTISGILQCDSKVGTAGDCGKEGGVI